MTKRPLHIAAVAAVVLVSLGLRLHAAPRLNVDYDEPVYLGDAVAYAKSLRLGDLRMLAWSETTYEHPALYKILYGVVLLTQPPLDRLPDKDLPRLAPILAAAAGPWNVAARYLSVMWGSVAVLALALVNPLAGLFLGLSTLSVKYTSEVYLEALPLLSSLLCASAYSRWFSSVRRDAASQANAWFWLMLSAIFLGITAASKYVYCVVGLAILIHFLAALFRGRVPRRLYAYIAGWAALSIVMFVIFDPYLWPHPIGRLAKSILFHEQFQDSRLVLQYHYPFWQPLRWLAAFSAYYDLGPSSAFVLNVDALIFVLALLGAPGLFRKQPIFFCWLATGLVFLLAWTTKWPQYTLIVLAPYSMAAAEGTRTVLALANRLIAPRSARAASAR